MVAPVCDASLTTFMLTHWARDRTRGDRISLEYAVHRITQHTARFYDLLDRGAKLRRSAPLGIPQSEAKGQERNTQDHLF